MAVVKGIIKKDEDTFVDYLLKLDNGNTIVTTKDKGKESVLTYKVLKRNYEKNETLVSIDLKLVDIIKLEYNLQVGDIHYVVIRDMEKVIRLKLLFVHIN